MARFKLAFGIHNHQPVGNFTAIFEEAHQKAYSPFVQLLSEFPAIRLSLHQSGILWDWQKAVHSEYFQQIGRLVDRGQIELMTGGFYEPILTSIPQRDALGQIRKLTDYLGSHFGCNPDGLWLTERIWEPHLPKLLAEAGIRYLPVDDTHFIYAGFEQAQLTGPFLTEDEGRAVTLLPIQKRLRYLIPFGDVEEVMSDLRSRASLDQSGMAVYADDGEKFGVWPKTYEHCYRDGWLRRFFEALARESDWLEVVPLGEAASTGPAGRAYLPTASYEEMLHWALPPVAFVDYEHFEQWLKSCGKKEQFGRFVRGGHWRGFLAKYEESNLMHKKMLRISDRLAALEKQPHPSHADLSAIREHLYASQCNCPYWHGVFGGLYLPHIRQGVYSHMVKATAALQEQSPSAATLTVEDYDRDGHDEILFESRSLGAIIKPRRGGMLIELCLNAHGFNLTDTLTRRREGYHLRLDRAVHPNKAAGQASIHDLVLAKEEGLKNYLVDDWYLKRCFVDHFFAADTDLARFRTGRFGEEGDFILEPYTWRVDEHSLSVSMRRDGFVRRTDGEFAVTVIKQLRFRADSEAFEVSYELTAPHSAGLGVSFGVENNFNFQAGHAEDRFVVVDGRRPVEGFLDSVGASPSAQSIALVDEYRSIAVAVTSDQPSELWRLPIFTVSLSEGGFEKVYQGTTTVHRFALRLSAAPIRLSFSVRAGEMSRVLPSAYATAALPG
ncbi:MAG: alpha-amylase/4-alpha-glucanotransferase domain-containing protein [Candidatus Zixiibacteriota bacterium]